MSQHTIPTIPAPVFPTEVEIKQFKGDIGDAFTAQLWYNGAHVADIDQSGEGGPNVYMFEDFGLSETLTEVARDWAIAAGYDDYACQSEEILDTLVEDMMMEQLLQEDAAKATGHMVVIEHLHHAEGFSPMVVRSNFVLSGLGGFLDSVLADEKALRYRIV